MTYVDKNVKDLQFVDYSKHWNETIKNKKQERIRELSTFISYLDWEQLKLQWVIEQMKMDLRETDLTLQFDGAIPEEIDEQAIEKCAQTWQMWETYLGEERFAQLKREVNANFLNYLVLRCKRRIGKHSPNPSRMW